jgi:quercetin dioxygenase-like cupin family protein
MNTPTKPLVLQPEMGTELHAFGNVLSIMLRSEQTRNTISVMLETTSPGGGPPLHVHSQEEEIFLVVEGRIGYCVERNWTEAGPGGVVYLPRGAAHCYRNVGDTPSRHWIITLPSGFEKFFASCAREFATVGRPDEQRIVKIHQEYGIEPLKSGG